ncbi:hypothetical protein [Marilutibacter spongiae]|uniref:Uncharacterized protein n=1 Tax=Marilutibacter spongiae TaxID=2025720 RepID=A0A7W3TJ35_9GAMM|nr:hypothetical protein [Lysobacter spongiae]MBB1059277.1 hypothetical protein [Lysobacter spongiae]
MVAPVALLLGGLAFFGVFRDSMFARADEPEEAAVSDGGASGASPAAQGPRTTISTPQAYAERFTAMVEPAPWTAPAYVDRPVVAEPVIACMSSGAGESATGYREASVTCVTEQGTRYQMDANAARDLARYGPAYNPFARPVREERQQAAHSEDERAAAPAPRSIRGSILNGPQMSHYGDIGVEPKPGT